MSDTEPPSPSELQFFELVNGAVSSDASQAATEAFAADLQGLRHFGRRIGTALDLGEPWHGGFREADFSHLWTFLGSSTAESDPAVGATVGRHAPYFEMMDHLTSHEV